MAVCSKCGAQVDDGVAFCAQCGQAMNAAPPPPPQNYQQPPQQAYQQPPQQPGYQQAPPPQGYQPPPQQGYGAPPPPGYGAPPPPGYGPRPMTDAEANKGAAILSYLWLLILIPIAQGKQRVSEFAKYHMNQGMNLAIFYTGYLIIDRILRSVIRVPIEVWGIPTGATMTPIWLGTVLWLLSIPFAVFCIMGIIKASQGKMEPIPIIGDTFVIFK